ncbi:MAG: MBL fold metallo-hydrolase [Acidobacteriota bacterium]|jgi:glyoxylase-like metal-dependent hydrolase (beta-lactamase superfamily II)/ferredoxin|nr:MBL fold metallo-hydrolase [Acidobacteriota bacterium]
MADRALRVLENVDGPFFVDSSCIDCDTCRQLAPATFADHGEHSYVYTQPRDDAEKRAALRALVACPTGSIGTSDPSWTALALEDFPLLLAPRVFYCGFNSRKSFGGNSYFVEHRDGNWLIDSPRYVEYLARQFTERGGVRYIFLTHRDDVADADRWAARFGATRIIHRLELASQPAAERVIDGREAVEVEPGFLAIPTPGHTRGHCVLLHDDQFLFTGDHIAWSRERQCLTASRDVCWHSWREQVKSVEKLDRYSFEWVLPGHGQRVRLPRNEMRHEMARLIQGVARA